MVAVSWCSSRLRSSLLGAFASAAMLLVAASALADSEVTWPVKGKLKGHGDKGALNISGIACDRADFPRLCLVIDDELQNAQVAILRDGELMAGETIPLIHDSLVESRWSSTVKASPLPMASFMSSAPTASPATARKSSTPSHDAAKIAARTRASSQVARVKIDPNTITNKGTLTADDPKLRCRRGSNNCSSKTTSSNPMSTRRWARMVCRSRASRSTAVGSDAGLRTPALDKGSPVLSVSLGAIFGRDAPDPQLHMLRLGAGRGVRDLASDGNGFLVLAGPATSKAGGFAIYRWNGAAALTALKELPAFHDKDGIAIRPEAVLPLDRTAAGSRLLLLFDGTKQGAPQVIQLEK